MPCPDVNEERIRIGVDLGGTKIEVIAMDEAYRTVLRRRVPTPAGDYDGIVEAIARLVEGVERELGSNGSIGVGTPGVTSPATGTIKNSNSTALIGHTLQADLEERLRRPLRMTNDANCFIRSEAVDGAAVGAKVAFGVIIGTGVGGAIAVDAHAIEGANGIAGEWGHNPLPWMRDDERPGPPCYCGKQGCIETFLSGPAFARAYHERTGNELTTHQIVANAAAGDARAIEAIARYEDQLARALTSIVNVVDPHVIVLGGGMSNVESLCDAVMGLLPRYVFSDHVATRVVRAHHGDSSGVRGAAMLWD